MLLSILCILIILIVLTISYKYTETFKNPDDPLNYPQTQDNYGCYDYIKNVKQWNPDTYTKDQKKALFQFRAGIGTESGNIENMFPFTNTCILPTSHLQLFNVQNCKLGDYQLLNTPKNIAPEGCMIKLDEHYTEDSFKKFLTDAYTIYDYDNIMLINNLSNQMMSLCNQMMSLCNQLNNVEIEKQNWITLDTNLLAPNSECSLNQAKFKELFKNEEDLYNYFMKLWNGCNFIDVNTNNLKYFNSYMDSIINTFSPYS
jgi:hypothetical protein